MTLTDALAAALLGHYARQCVPPERAHRDAAAILADPAFRESLTAALAETFAPLHGPSYFAGLHDVTIFGNTPHDAAELIVAHMLPEADHATD